MKKVKGVPKIKKEKIPAPIRIMGVVLPRNDFTKLLVNQHVVAVQEYDHRRAEILERFIVDLGNCYKLSAEQKQRQSYLKMASDMLYELDDKIGMEFHKPSPPLFLTATHGYILAELCEIRALINCAINTNEKAEK
jgi:hypothetical protein